jgi:hypothetical protein
MQLESDFTRWMGYSLDSADWSCKTLPCGQVRGTTRLTARLTAYLGGLVYLQADTTDAIQRYGTCNVIGLRR